MIKSLYRTTNRSYDIDVVYYTVINGDTVHIIEYHSQSAGGVIKIKRTREQLIGRHHRYHFTYQDAWDTIRMRLERKISQVPLGTYWQDKLRHHMTQRLNWTESNRHEH